MRYVVTEGKFNKVKMEWTYNGKRTEFDRLDDAYEFYYNSLNNDPETIKLEVIDNEGNIDMIDRLTCVGN